MVLELALLLTEKGGDPDLVRESQRRRFQREDLVDRVIQLHREWRSARHGLDTANAALRTASKTVGQLMKAGRTSEAEELKCAQVAPTKAQIDSLKAEVADLEAERDKTLSAIGNIVHYSVPVSADESDNELVRKVGSFVQRPNNVEQVREHYELLELIGGVDTVRGARVAGDRGYFLIDVGAELSTALVRYALDFLAERGATPVQPPYYMASKLMECTAQLEDFDEQLYKVGASSGDRYLIATAEQPISAMHAKEWLKPADLPLFYVGYSTCFRKETGSGGRDVRGIFRVHQFDKVEQFAITSPEDSWRYHEQLTRNAEEFLQSLGLSYRVVAIASGALNNAASKKYDIEAWFPGYNDCRELVSSSNCTDYQSRSLDIRYGIKRREESAKVYAHMLNATLCATTRTICCILENYQTNHGVIVPHVLRKYLQRDFLPFVRSPTTPATAATSSSSTDK